MAAVAAFVDRYAERESALHRADARAKFLGTVAYIFVVTSTREGDWLALALLLVPVIVLVGISRLGYGFVLRRTFLALPFVAAALPLIFTRAGETVFTMPIVGWTASDEGLIAVASIMARSWVAVGVAAVFVACTPPAELLRALRWLRVPRLLVSTLFFTYRYLFVIGDEGQRMLRARASRSASMAGHRAGGSVTWRAKVAGHMVGSLFVRSLERSERVYAAMQSRGYSGEARFLDERVLPRTELMWAIALVAYGVLVQTAVRSW
ncbi:MAG: cobalt ECF transporter T component CbiQ [Dehalococcoidia bacterium]